MTLKEWFKQWYSVYKVPFVSSSTLDLVRYAFNHILPVFGDTPLSDIRGIDIQRLLNSLSSKPNMKDKVYTYLNELLSYAVANQYLSFNPMLAVKYKPHRYSNTIPMNQSERTIFIRSLQGKPYEALYLGYLYTGARRNELIAPNGFEVDFEKKLVYIHGTKTERSERIVPLFSKFETVLTSLPDYKAYYSSYKPDYVYLRLRRHLARMDGFSQFNVRSLRCTFSLMCYELGVRDITIQSWLGHTTLRTTATYYLNKQSVSTSESDTVSAEIALVNANL